MNVRLGTAYGLNLLYVSHWTYEEVPIDPPPDPPAADPEPEVDDPSVQMAAEEARLAREMAGSVPEPPAVEARYTDLPPSSSAAPAPEGRLVAPAAQATAKTLTLYMTGEATPLVLNDDEAAAVLGVLVSQSGSLT